MSGEVTLEQVLALVPEEGHAIHIYDQEGNDYFCGYKDSINEEEPVPDLVLTGLYCNTEDLKDGSGEIPVIEMEVSPRNEKQKLKEPLYHQAAVLDAPSPGCDRCHRWRAGAGGGEEAKEKVQRPRVAGCG